MDSDKKKDHRSAPRKLVWQGQPPVKGLAPPDYQEASNGEQQPKGERQPEGEQQSTEEHERRDEEERQGIYIYLLFITDNLCVLNLCRFYMMFTSTG